MYLQQLTQEQQAKLLEVIGKRPGGASIDELQDYGGLGLPLRTLQRRINALVKQGALRVTGQTRATRYHAVVGTRAPAIEQRGKAKAFPTTVERLDRSHIDLKRRFSTFVSPETETNDDYIAAWRFHSSLSWSQVLDNPCSVIVAEAGAGKTSEFRNQALVLRANDNLAFFCRLDLLITSPLADCLEIGNPRELAQWQAGANHAYFFLDSVDEAKLARVGDFERALLHFIEAIEPHKARCSIVISTRPAAWQVFADADMLCRRLGIRRPRRADEIADGERDAKDGMSNYDLDTPARDVVDAANTDESQRALAVLQMAPLNSEQIKTFAAECGVTDLEDFWHAIASKDAEAFATRPDDLTGLIEMWLKARRIGSYTEVIEANLRLKLLENNRRLQDAISSEQARTGAETLAAAVTFTGSTSILLLGDPVDPQVRTKAIDPQHVLKNWRPAEINALLTRPLFDESLYGSVRFHHRTAREYLTARWLIRMLDRGKCRRSIEHLLFARPYPDHNVIIVPAMKPIVAWLSTWDQRIRDKVLRIDPKVLLERGDVSSFDVAVRKSILSNVASRYKDRKHTPVDVNIREVRRLADPDLSTFVRDMLTTHPDHTDLRQLLLRIVREGALNDCADLALQFALAPEMDPWTRVYAIQAFAKIGTAAHHQALKRAIVSDPASFGRQVLGAAIESLFGKVLVIQDIIRVLEAAPAADEYSSDHFSHEMEQLAGRLNTDAEKWEMLRSVERLLSMPPLIDPEFCRTSRRYAWLLQFAALLVGDLFERCEAPFEPAMLSVFLRATQADHMQRYTGDIKKEAVDLIASNYDLKHAIFWYGIEQKRVRSTGRITGYWFVGMIPEVAMADEHDFHLLLDALRHRSLVDDKLIALAALWHLHLRANKPPHQLSQLKEAVAGTKELEEALRGHMHPPPEPEELRDSWRQLKQAERQNAARVKRNEVSRQRWIKTLIKDPTRVGDLALAPKGGVWNNTVWLFDEIRSKGKNNNDWTVSDWELLVPDFGVKVAQNFRDFCQAFWRGYTPETRSEAGGDKQTTPYAVLIGLSGLAMEARSSAQWAERLSREDAARAVRYALCELNNLPAWLWPLYRHHPDAVTDVLVREMSWELDSVRQDGASGYILSRLRWGATDLACALRPEIIGLLAARPSPHVPPLVEALTIILRNPAPLPDEFMKLVAQRVHDADTDQHKGLWIAAMICVDAKKGVKWLEKWVDAVDPKLGEEHVTTIFNHLWGDDSHGLNSQHRDFARADILVQLLKLAHSHIRYDDDIHHKGVYSPGPRDHAQRARSHILETLCGQPGRKTFEGLRELAELHRGTFLGDRFLVLAEERAEADVEPAPWRPRDLAEFAAEAERFPASQAELFLLVVARLDDLKLDLEEGDESEASLLQKVEDEFELRRVIANRLKYAARGKYTTGSEEELADESRTDIRLHNPMADARIPIELKIADKPNWTAAALAERLQNQLVGQYMREAHYGVFLLVRRGAQGDRKQWSIPEKSDANFLDLVTWLSAEAASLVSQHPEVKALEVVGIDLTARSASPRAPEKSVSSTRKKSAGRERVQQRTLAHGP